MYLLLLVLFIHKFQPVQCAVLLSVCRRHQTLRLRYIVSLVMTLIEDILEQPLTLMADTVLRVTAQIMGIASCVTALTERAPLCVTAFIVGIASYVAALSSSSGHCVVH